VTELDRASWGTDWDDGWDDDRPLELEDLYDEMTLRRLGLWSERESVGADEPVARVETDEPVEEAWSSSASSPPQPPPARRGRHPGLAGAMLAGAMIGLGDVLEPEKRKDAVIEPELLGEPAVDQPVQFIMVPGLPRASVVILRPWLRTP
jgi:hypothetical protein